MNPALENVWKNMLALGVGSLAHANCHAAYSDMGHGRWPVPERWSDLSVLQAGHAAEIFIKARIAQEHPLLIFDQFPRSTKSLGSELDVVDLFKSGRTVQWSDLPERLWATTGIKLPNLERYDSFGKLRNGLQHFGPTQGVDTGSETLKFVFEVIDPFINQCWGLFAVDFDENTEEYNYFPGTLVSREILFLVSLDAASEYKNWEADWSEVSDDYRIEMQQRVKTRLAEKV